MALILAGTVSNTNASTKKGGSAAPKTTAPAPLSAKSVTSLSAVPAKIVLSGPYTESRVLVDARLRTGGIQDASAVAALSVADKRVAKVDADGMVRPCGDGATVLTARFGALKTQVPIVVRGMAKAAPPRFVTDVIPILTKTGCNQGACHGAAAGKGGFKLSLLGYDPDADYDAITRAAGARRITRSQPENSLLLRKPTFRVTHKGGKRFDVGSPEYRLLRDWITRGLPGPAPTEPRVTKLEVVPAVRTLAPGLTQRLLVRARYSDGTTRDVSGQTLFTANEEAVASVTLDGESKVNGPGEGAIVVRYQGLVSVARLISPYGATRTSTTSQGAKSVDSLVSQKLDALGLQPSHQSLDSDFQRRVTLDVTGLLPTPDEARAFLASHDPKKREKLIDSLLERPEYVDFWAMKWADMLRDSRRSLDLKGMYAFSHWIRQSVEENRPWDQFARQIMLASGSAFDDGPANFYRASRTPQELAETTSQVFLGVRIQCAKCHNHPYDKWTQNQYYQMAAFFARVKEKDGARKDDEIIYTVNKGEVYHPKTQKAMTPCALDSTPVQASYTGDRREALADWLTSPKNPFFTRIIVNRVWKHFMGRGLVEPIDDLRATNPASNEALFAWLSQDLIEHKYDLKHLMRTIMRSQTYQRSAEISHDNERDSKYYSHFPLKRLGAEQLLDALNSTTGVPEKFEGYPVGTRAAQLPDTTVPSYFLDLFGRPARNITCECERTDAPSLGQVLHLMNNGGLNERLAAKTGRVATLVNAKLPPGKMVEDLYLATLSRFPTKQENQRAMTVLNTAKDRQRAGEDLLWALLNTKEFLFNH